MTQYYVTFERTFAVYAENEDEAYEKAHERASEYRLDEADEVTIEEV